MDMGSLPWVIPQPGLFSAGLFYDLVKLIHFFSWFMTFAILSREAKKLNIKESAYILWKVAFSVCIEKPLKMGMCMCGFCLDLITELCSGLSVTWVIVSCAQCYTNDGTCLLLGQGYIWMYLHFCKGDVFFCFSVELQLQCVGSV